MADRSEHRCLVCEPGHHAHLWTLWSEATAGDAMRVITLVGLSPRTVRRATDTEALRLLGHLEADRVLWISQHAST